MKHEQVKKLTVLAMLCAVAFVMVALVRIPAVLFLNYEPKDVIIAFGGFLYGPVAALIISAVVSFLEFLTISSTGWIGMIMNFLSSAAFAGTAALVYRKKHTLSGAVIGLVLGSVAMTVVMLIWNYALTPLYMDTARADVAAMLIPVFLPFNLLKSGLNSAITIFLYRPLVQGLRRVGLFPQSSIAGKPTRKGKLWVWLGAAVILAVCVLFLLYWNQII